MLKVCQVDSPEYEVYKHMIRKCIKGILISVSEPLWRNILLISLPNIKCQEYMRHT